MAGTWRRDRAGLVAWIAAAATLLGPAVAAADRPASRISISSRVPAFHGRVSSPRSSCVEDRKVQLFRKVPGSGRNVLGVDVTSSGGRWKVAVDDVDSGVYFARVKGSRLCRGARSENAAIG